MKNVNAPDILIAGCGTGQQAIETACRLFGCQGLATGLINSVEEAEKVNRLCLMLQLSDY